jgi:hypothetical protein
VPPVGFIASSPAAAVGNEFAFATPAAANQGDVLIAIIATTDNSTVLSVTSTDFETLAHLEIAPPASGRGQIWVLRHVVVDGDVAQLVATASATPTKGAGVMLLFRGLDPFAALVAGDTSNVVGATNFACPSGVLAAYSDMYLGIAFVEASVDVTPPAGTTELADVAGVFGACELEVFQLLAEAVGATGTKTATTAAAQSGMAAAALLAAQAVQVAPSITPDIPGAIGFVTVGV